MEQGDELKILIEAALDLEKSFQNIVADMRKLQKRMKTYQIKVLAGLDKDASTRQIKNDLAQIAKTKGRVKIVGEVDKSATRKNVDTAIKNLKNAEIKLTGVLDSSATQRNVQQQLGQIPKLETTANVNVSGGNEVDKLRTQMANAGESAAGMASKLYIARSALQLLRRTAIEAKETIIELDSAATDLALATGSNSGEAYKLLEQYNALGKRLGATTAQVAEGATEWLRQGKDAAETSALIEQSMILSKVGAMTADTATKSLTSTMKGFKLETAEAADVVDRLTALDLRAAVTSEDLATAVARTASSANLAGVGLDKLLGYITIVEETTQKSAETIGESFKTLFSRLGNIKLGKFLDDDGEDLSDVEKVLNNFGIKLRENKDKFRDFGVVLDEVAAKWSGFTNVEQSAIATTMAGTRQRENFLVLMQNYSKSLEYAEISANSAGTALQKFEGYQDSIAAKSASFVAAMENLTMSTIDSDLVKDLIDAATATIEFVEAAGLLKATLLALGTGAALKGVQLIAGSFKNVTQHIMNMGEAANILRRVGDASALSGEQIKRLGRLIKGLSDDQLKLILSSRNLSTAQMQAILQASGLTKAEAAQKIQTLGLATAQQTTAGATWSLSAALNGLKVAIMSNPIGALMTAVAAATVVFSLISNAIEDAKQKEEEARQKMLEVADAAKEEADAISGLYDTYTQANKAYQDGVGSKDDLTSATDSLLKALGYEKNAVSELIKEYGTLEAAIDGVTKKSLEQKAASILEGYDAAKQAALSAAEDSMGWFSGSTITVKTNGDDKKFAELLQKAGYLGNGDLPLLSTSLYTGINNYGDIDTLVEGYEKLLAIKELLESGIGNEYSAEELSGAGVYTDVVAKINAVSDEIEAYRDIIKAYNEAQAQIAYMDFAEANGVPETREEYNALKQSLLDAAEASGKYIGSQEEIEAAIANMLATRPALQEFFATSVEAAEDVTTYKAELSELTDVISALQSSYNALDAAQADMAGSGGLSPETIEKLAKAEENYLDYLYEENGVVKLNTEAWKENANAKMQGEMADIQKEIDSLEEENAVLSQRLEILRQNKHMSAGDSALTEAWDKQIQEATAKIAANTAAIEKDQKQLSMYEVIFDSITGAASNLASTLDAFDTATTGLESLAKVQDAVANGYVISAEKAREFAAVYPEILSQAEVSADGQMTLNADIVNSFIASKEDEIRAATQAEITKLQAKEALLQAELGIVEAEIQAAESGDEAQVKSAKDAADAQILLEQAVLSACEQAGIDETTANQMATAAMTGDWDTFTSLAQDAVDGLDDESAIVFNSVMTNFAKMSQNMVDNTNQIIGAYSQMGLALQNAMNGVQTNGYSGSITFSGVSASGDKNANAGKKLLSDMFDAAKSDYGNGSKQFENSLDEYRDRFQEIVDDAASKPLDLSELKKQRDSIQKQISSVRGQISLLESLKNTPLKTFGGSSSKSGGSSSSVKEVEEYIADIDEYREAVERLRKAQAEVERITTDIDNAGSIEKKIALEKELVDAYQEEQAALHNLNNLRDGTITAGVKTLQDLGFAVKYNADTNELWVENLEHLNELTADSKGQYSSLKEATNALRKDTEELINTITDLNEANREGSATWWEVQRAILEAKIAVCEFEAQLHNNVLTLTENWLDNAINQKNSEGVKRYTSEMIANYKALQDVYRKQAEALREAGYSDTTDEIVELSDAWWDLADKIKDAKDKVVDYFVELVDAANDAVDSIQNVSDVLSDAAQEFADNDGWISVDTYQSIIALGTEYMQMLINENNELVINRERINSIIEAKTRQLAVEQALSYVERLRLAATGASNESLDQLCFATTQATNSTWGLVYAELALMQQTGLLNGSQYQAALHNIQAIQSLAETAVAGIGQTAGAAAEKMDKLKEQLEDQKDALEDLLDELEDMKDGCDDLVKYVMDMLKDRIQQQIDALNDAKKAVKDYVDQLKEAMRAEKENVEYEDELADKLKAIAKLQSKIDALSLDDSRKAQAEKMALEEELAELQKDLADFQADHAMDVTEDALDKQYEAYEQEKDAEIEKLEESISSTQKLYDMAIKYIKENWNTLYQELLDWNYEYGNSLNSEITAAWEAAQEAASRYGDFVTAIMGGIENEIAKITAQIQSLTTQISNLSNSTSGAGGNGIGGSMPNVVGTVNTDTSYSDEDMKQAKRKAVSDVVSQMRALSSQWHTADKATKKRLEDQALQLGATLASYGIVAHHDEPTGAWYIDNDLLNPSNAGKLLYSCYHTGGFVGEEPLKPNERYVKAENGELILTSEQQDGLAARIDRFKTMADAFSRSVMAMPVNTDSLWPKGFAEGGSSTSNVSTDNSRTITVNEGDIYISVPSPDGKTIADEVRTITRDNLNQISRYLRRP